MGRFGYLSWLSNKAALEAAIVALLALSGWVIVHQLRQVSASSGGSQVHSINLHAANTNDQSGSSLSDKSESSLNSTQSSNSNHTSVTVNGQPIDVPANGSTSQTLNNPDGSTTTVETQSQSNSSTSSTQGGASNSSNSSVSVHVNNSSGGGQ